jgi:hypothetical protein
VQVFLPSASAQPSSVSVHGNSAHASRRKQAQITQLLS